MARTRVVVDPITRIEGHLRIEAQAENGRIANAWASSTQFRGIEIVMQGRDPRDAWAFTQRICGVCTVVHAVASCRAVEDALDITIPPNANLIRNLVHGMQFIQDHVIHFYHLHALDWVDVVSALKADPTGTAAIAAKVSPWPNNSASHFRGVQERLKKFVAGGQLGIFTNGYWGPPAYKLPRRSTGSATSSGCIRCSAARTPIRTSWWGGWPAPSTWTTPPPSTRSG
jgi:[NiFe] hydrogenase large subunit/hydrogenase large subunit